MKQLGQFILYIVILTAFSCQLSPLLFSQTNKRAVGKEHVLKLKNRSPQIFVKSEDSEDAGLDSRINLNRSASETVIPQVYYRNGIQSESTRYITTGHITVSFGKDKKIAYKQFAAENKLKFIREINHLYHTALFKVLVETGLIQQVNLLNQLPTVRYAKPDWISPRKLR